jgi:hypothetical protein
VKVSVQRHCTFGSRLDIPSLVSIIEDILWHRRHWYTCQNTVQPIQHTLLHCSHVSELSSSCNISGPNKLAGPSFKVSAIVVT